ncbi:RHS repeat-associated core domain-containing protein, partial [Burkholderia stagnalis]
HATLFYQNDHLGTPQELVDESGKVVWLGRYRAWGGEKAVWRETPERNEVANPVRFPGQYRDEETGLHYNRHRYYDPGTGRFVSKDPIGLAGGINVYQYAPNPVEWIDPFGLSKYVPAPKNLPGFPEAVRVSPKTPIPGIPGKKRARWKEPKGCICEWDYQHEEVERYDKRGNHMGAFDLNSGEPIPGKGPVRARRVEP